MLKSKTNFLANFLNSNRFERIFLLAKTDFSTRYYGSVLGLLWAFINPFFKLLVYYFAFSYLIFRNRDHKFVLYLFTGIILWTFFAQTTKQGMRVLNTKRYLIQNIEINKVDIFLSHAISNFIGLLFNLFSWVR